MKKLPLLLFFLFFLFFAVSLKAQYKPVEQGSTLDFSIRNFGFSVPGTFSGFQGAISFDPATPGTDSFDVSIAAATVNTGNKKRDEHLREDDYFAVSKFPRIRLVSVKITTAGKAGSYTFNGQLTMKGKTRPVSFPFTVTAIAGGFEFAGGFSINRRDFEIGGTSTLSNELDLKLKVIALK